MLTYGYIEFELTDTISKVKVILIGFQYQLHKNTNIASIVREEKSLGRLTNFVVFALH